MASNRAIASVDPKVEQKKIDKACQKKNRLDLYGFVWYSEKNVAIVSGFKDDSSASCVYPYLMRYTKSGSDEQKARVAECRSLLITKVNIQNPIGDKWVTILASESNTPQKFKDVLTKYLRHEGVNSDLGLPLSKQLKEKINARLASKRGKQAIKRPRTKAQSSASSSLLIDSAPARLISLPELNDLKAEQKKMDEACQYRRDKKDSHGFVWYPEKNVAIISGFDTQYTAEFGARYLTAQPRSSSTTEATLKRLKECKNLLIESKVFQDPVSDNWIVIFYSQNAASEDFLGVLKKHLRNEEKLTPGEQLKEKIHQHHPIKLPLFALPNAKQLSEQKNMDLACRIKTKNNKEQYGFVWYRKRNAAIISGFDTETSAESLAKYLKYSDKDISSEARLKRAKELKALPLSSKVFPNTVGNGWVSILYSKEAESTVVVDVLSKYLRNVTPDLAWELALPEWLSKQVDVCLDFRLRHKEKKLTKDAGNAPLSAQDKMNQACQKSKLNEKYGFVWYPERNAAIVSGFNSKRNAEILTTLKRKKSNAKRTEECQTLQITSRIFRNTIDGGWVSILYSDKPASEEFFCKYLRNLTVEPNGNLYLSDSLKKQVVASLDYPSKEEKSANTLAALSEQDKMDLACQRKECKEQYGFVWCRERNAAVISGFDSKASAKEVSNYLMHARNSWSETVIERVAECRALSITSKMFPNTIGGKWVLIFRSEEAREAILPFLKKHFRSKETDLRLELTLNRRLKKQINASLPIEPRILSTKKKRLKRVSAASQLDNALIDSPSVDVIRHLTIASELKQSSNEHNNANLTSRKRQSPAAERTIKRARTGSQDLDSNSGLVELASLHFASPEVMQVMSPLVMMSVAAASLLINDPEWVEVMPPISEPEVTTVSLPLEIKNQELPAETPAYVFSSSASLDVVQLANSSVMTSVAKTSHLANDPSIDVAPVSAASSSSTQIETCVEVMPSALAVSSSEPAIVAVTYGVEPSNPPSSLSISLKHMIAVEKAKYEQQKRDQLLADKKQDQTYLDNHLLDTDMLGGVVQSGDPLLYTSLPAPLGIDWLENAVWPHSASVEAMRRASSSLHDLLVDAEVREVDDSPGATLLASADSERGDFSDETPISATSSHARILTTLFASLPAASHETVMMPVTGLQSFSRPQMTRLITPSAPLSSAPASSQDFLPQLKKR